MKVAEALAERADVQKRIEDLGARTKRMARIQEGDVPDEDPRELLTEVERLLARLQELMTRINATNSATLFDDSSTITDAIAERDVVGRRHRFYAQLADAASVRQDRYSRTEVKFVSTLDVAALRAQADAAARRYRELDTRLQQLNWNTELL